MSCSRCADLCIEAPIRTPEELRRTLRIFHANLEDGAITETVVGPFTSSVAGSKPEGPWDDLIASDFRCMDCGEVFHLRCETYHGGGGGWSYGGG